MKTKRIMVALLALGAYFTSNAQWLYSGISVTPTTASTATIVRSGEMDFAPAGLSATTCTSCTTSKFTYGQWTLANNTTATPLQSVFTPGNIVLLTIPSSYSTPQFTLNNTGFSLISEPSGYPGWSTSLDYVNGIKMTNGSPAQSISGTTNLRYGAIALTFGANPSTPQPSNVLSLSNVTNVNTFNIDGNTMNLSTSGAVTIGTTAAPKTLTLNGSLVNTGTAVFGTTTTPSSVTVNGTVGIGTTNATLLASYKLAVNGGIVATAMDINGTVPASDYVFEKDYKLRSLTETEAYVNEHKHLPEVPSALEFKTNGYSVGKFDDIMLKKVEELTLYMIELQKQNEALKAKVESLEKAVH